MTLNPKVYKRAALVVERSGVWAGISPMCNRHWITYWEIFGCEFSVFSEAEIIVGLLLMAEMVRTGDVP